MSEYKFIIVNGKKKYVTEELKRLIPAEYPNSARPIPGKTENGMDVFVTSDKTLFTHLCDIGFVESIAAYRMKLQLEVTHKELQTQTQDTEFYTINDNGGIVFKRNKIAEYLLSTYHARVVSDKKYMFVYNYDSNIYEINYGSIFETKINVMFKDNINLRETQEIMNKVWHTEKYQVPENSLVWTNDQYINLRNGVLDLETMILHDHDPEKFFFQSIIPHDYDPDAKCPNILMSLHNIFGDSIDDELEWVGFCMTPGYRYKEISIYIGSSNSGKSTFFNLITALVGEDNRASIEPHDMEKEHYVYYLHHKMVNIAADIGKHKIKGFHKLKQLSGNDYVIGNEKFKPLVQFYNEAKIIIGTNIMPLFDDDSDAVFSRLRIITCTNVFSHEDRINFDFSSCTTESEMSGFINESLSAYKRVTERGGFIKPDPEETALIHDMMSNRLWVWGREELVFTYNDDNQLWMDELFSLYKSWCKRNNMYMDLKRNSFGTAFRKKFHGEIWDERMVKKKTCIIGVKYRKTFLRSHNMENKGSEK